MRKSILLTASAALTLALATALPSASFAAPHGGGGGGHFGGGGGGHFGGGAHFAGGRVGGGAAFARPMAGAAPAGRAWNGGGTAWNGGGGRGGWHRNGWWPGAVAAGVALGGAYGYYGAPYYDDSYAYYDGDYGPDYGDSGVAVVPAAPVGGDASYCAQRYRSYDPASGTFLGYDGLRHPCP
jgi:hypothetical protein